jgi:trigger factor
LIEEELERMIGEMQQEFERRHLSWQQYLDTASQSEADIRNDMRESAAQNVKTSLVLAAVADEENIETPNREIDAALEDLFRGAQTSETERRRLRSSAGVRTNIRNRIRRQRAVQRLVSIMSGEDVSAEAAEDVADQTAAAADDLQETVAVEVGG